MAENIQHGRAEWPLAFGVVSGTYTISHGIAPSVATLTMPLPSRNPAGRGTLKITDGDGIVRLPNCKLDKVSVSYTDQGKLMTLYILDRRWKWEFGMISGTYNVRDAKGDLVLSTVRDAVQLARACLIAMGETGFAIEGLPVTEYPFVEWDHANPAESLQSLCDLYGCRVIYRHTSDTVLIAQTGVGDGLPAARAIKQSTPAVDFPERPDSVIIVGNDVRYEAMFTLDAVGEDIDGQVKLIDDLFYRPVGGNGWSIAAPPNFPNIPRLALSTKSGDLTNEQQHQRILELAAKSVYKWYRISIVTSPAGDLVEDFTIPGYGGTIIRREQILLESVRLKQVLQHDGTWADMPAEVSGVFARDKQTSLAATDAFGNSENSERIESTFTIDSERGLVMFNDFVFRRKDSKIFPAQLRLRCAVRIRDAVTGALSKYELALLSGNPEGNGPAIVHKPELSLRVQGVYSLRNKGQTSNPTWRLVDVLTNRDEIDPIAGVFAKVAAEQYGSRAAEEITYPGIVPLSPDGAIQQITWTFGPDGCSTTASRNTEHAFWLPSYQQIRERQVIKAKVINEPKPSGGKPSGGKSFGDKWKNPGGI